MQKLITAEIGKKATKFPLGSQDGKKGEALVLARFFTPANRFTWYMLEYDRKTGEAFGLCVGDYAEYGYFRPEELQNAKQEVSVLGYRATVQAVERDISVKPGKETLETLMKQNKEKCPDWRHEEEKTAPQGTLDCLAAA